MSNVFEVLKKIENFTNEIHTGIRKGYTNKQFTDIVNIGIGGSDLVSLYYFNILNFF